MIKLLLFIPNMFAPHISISAWCPSHVFFAMASGKISRFHHKNSHMFPWTTLRCLHGNTQLANLEPPRMLYFQVGCLTEFRRIQNIFQNSRHDCVLTRQEETQVNLLSSRQVFSYLATALTKACLECRKCRDRSKHRKEAGGNYWWQFFPIHHVQPDLITRPLAPDAGESTCKSGRVAVCRVACLGTMFRSSEPANPAAQLSMQSTINDNLEARIAYLENALAFLISRHLNHELVKSLVYLITKEPNTINIIWIPTFVAEIHFHKKWLHPWKKSTDIFSALVTFSVAWGVSWFLPIKIWMGTTLQATEKWPRWHWILGIEIWVCLKMVHNYISWSRTANIEHSLNMCKSLLDNGFWDVFNIWKGPVSTRMNKALAYLIAGVPV